ncbi:PLP-dependent aminotransferase family protein [Nocardioides perillae]|uniref:DNA-binding transcriptional MocR family regulator n=1 Tax=Nocardioides perillae TaxID=1119534 RepID=A0A7Y9ULG9_9ACTN|nr:DNA-binding transcriptional MocR family regulator [Nocardioides perillae]
MSATRVATLVAGFDRSPAYAGLAAAVRLAVGDGRIAVGTRLPSERELTAALGVSRTTVTRAYAALCEEGWAEARRGAGTFTRVPGGRARAFDRALVPRPGDEDAVDLNCAAPSAPPGLAEAHAAAAADLPAYLGGHGYFPAGLPVLQQAVAAAYDQQGLPTDPGQVLVTAGALSATAIVAHGLLGAGDRALVETPVYPNAVQAFRHAGARVLGAPVDPDGWDLDVVAAALRQAAPRTAYLIPDFQNPTGLLMDDAQREEYAAALRRTRTVAVVDEAHRALVLDDDLERAGMPAPFAVHSPDAITLGSASKSHWGGLRLGWVRAPRDLVDRLTRARLGVDLGAPVLEQLVLARLLGDDHEVAVEHRRRLRRQRDALVAAVARELPSWRTRVPQGGLALWCELPEPVATALAAEADQRGVVVAPGPTFAVEGGLGRFVRLPWTRPEAELELAVRRLAEAWARVAGGAGVGPGSAGRASRDGSGGPVMVA